SQLAGQPRSVLPEIRRPQAIAQKPPNLARGEAVIISVDCQRQPDPRVVYQMLREQTRSSATGKEHNLNFGIVAGGAISGRRFHTHLFRQRPEFRLSQYRVAYHRFFPWFFGVDAAASPCQNPTVSSGCMFNRRAQASL